jgi:hypothetical protein
MSTIEVLDLILVIVILLILLLTFLTVFIIIKIRNGKPKKQKERIDVKSTEKKDTTTNLITRNGVGIDSIYKFMEFDNIVDNMIVRKNGKQYVMIMECKGVNYDLLSEDEKDAVQMGFIELLNTLRFPIQLYVQTRTLDLTNTIKKYEKRTDAIKDSLYKLKTDLNDARYENDLKKTKEITEEINKKENILEYAKSIEDYTIGISSNKNILQQKMYLIISYFPSEYGDISKYSKEEINDIAFSELYTRSQAIKRSLLSAEVNGNILSSEQLVELLYVAYNKDESETYTLNNALEADYTRLYSTAVDVMEEKKRKIEEKVNEDAQKLVAKSIIKADLISREERAKKVKEEAQKIADEYKNQISEPLYNETKRQIANATVNEALNEEEKRRMIKRK